MRDAYLTSANVANNSVISGKAGECVNVTLFASKNKEVSRPSKMPSASASGFSGNGSLTSAEPWSTTTVHQKCYVYGNDWNLTLDPNFTGSDAAGGTYVLVRGNFANLAAEDCDSISECCCDNFDPNTGDGAFLNPFAITSDNIITALPWNDQAASLAAGPTWGTIPAGSNTNVWITDEELADAKVKLSLAPSVPNITITYNPGDCAHQQLAIVQKRVNPADNSETFYNVVYNY